ncbi:MAG: hypothetical protein SFY80_05880 [Verrucomicrobiota bacterium]|nr:hypothetical protein [Verrucomicrobiota bacterium]
MDFNPTTSAIRAATPLGWGLIGRCTGGIASRSRESRPPANFWDAYGIRLH